MSVILAQIKRSLKDWFLLGMISGVVLASAFPTLGSTGGLLRIDRFADVGIFLIFFFHGLALSPQSLKAGMLRLKLHADSKGKRHGGHRIAALSARSFRTG